MRNFLIAVIVVLLVPFSAGAFTVPEEVQVTKPPASVETAAPAPTPARSSDKTYKAVKSLDRKLVGKKGMVTLIKEKVQSLYSEMTITKNAALDAQAKADAAMKSAEGAKNAVTALDKKLTDKNTGEFKQLKDTAWSVGNELSKDMTKMIFWIIGAFLLLAVIIILVIIRRTRRANVNLQPVEDGIADVQSRSEEILNEVRNGFAEMRTGINDLPRRTADAVKAFDLRPIDVTVVGHHAVFTQLADATAREVYQYIDVDEDIDPSVTVDTYDLPETKNRDKAYDKIRQAIREYYNGGLQKKAAAGSNAAKLKIAIVEYLRDTTGQLVINIL